MKYKSVPVIKGSQAKPFLQRHQRHETDDPKNITYQFNRQSISYLSVALY